MKNYGQYFCTILACCIARHVPVHFIWGSLNSWFGISSIFAPVAAQYCGFGILSVFLFSYKTMTLAGLAFSFLHRLPLLLSSYAYSNYSSFIIPLVLISCFIAFAIHP